MINRHRIRRILAPTAGVRGAIVSAFLGTIILLGGVILSFHSILLPAVDNIGHSWNEIASRFVAADQVDEATHVVGGGLLILGTYLMFQGSRHLLRRLIETLNPGFKAGMVNAFVRKQQLAQGPKIVALGGGTGLSTLLRGLKQHSSNITAIVTVTDDGGSSGRLVSEMGIIPPGDIRNCLVALADAERLMTDLFQHRFAKGAGSLSGHSLGNLLIAGLVQQCDGDFDRALAMASDVLNIRGRVVPSTLEIVKLKAELGDGSEITGETAIVASGKRIRRIHLSPEQPSAHEAAIRAIQDADLICIGPGSVFTSVIPNLLVPGIADALAVAEAKKVYVCNVMTQPGESDSFTAAEHVHAIQANTDQKIMDYVLVNSGLPSSATIEKYREFDQFVVDPDVDRIRALGFRVISGNFVNEVDYVRHDPFKVARRLVELLDQ